MIMNITVFAGAFTLEINGEKVFETFRLSELKYKVNQYIDTRFKEYELKPNQPNPQKIIIQERDDMG